MDLLDWLISLGPAFIFIILIFLFCIFISPLMCWTYCKQINNKIDEMINYLSSINDNTTLSLINSDEELKEKLIEEMNEE